jgi:hypothetical protein
MRLLHLAFTGILSVSPVEATFQHSRVISIDPSPSEGLPHLVFLENGQVIFVSTKETNVFNFFKEKLKIDKVDSNEARDEWKFQAEPISFQPTILTSSSRSREIFSKFRRDYQSESQCYNRAHVWAWEEYYYQGLKSNKHFLFFTTSYIRRYRYQWWFHVAPSVLVAGKGEEILDGRYANKPLGVREWTKKFVLSGRSCPKVSRYNDYYNNQASEDCYLISVPMYYWQPRDIERRDQTGIEKKGFLGRELDVAYGEAF